MKNSLEDLAVDWGSGRKNSKLKDRSVEIIVREAEREKNKEKSIEPKRPVGYHLVCTNICINRFAEGK